MVHLLEVEWPETGTIKNPALAAGFVGSVGVMV